VSDAAARHSVTGTSASKAWNIPGLKAAQLITSNDADEQRYRRFGFATAHGASTLGVVASTAAYAHGAEWLRSVTGYLEGNRETLDALVRSELPGARFSAPDATYLGWIDVRELGIHGSPADFFRERAGVALTDGALCGSGAEGFVRLVFAMPRPLLEDALRAMGDAIRR
jgi:cystathionine beta-lyase